MRQKNKSKSKLSCFEEKEKQEGIVVQAPCKIFDWVEITKGQHKGVIGVAIEVNKCNREIFLEAARHKDGNKVNGKSWFNWDHIKLLPYEIDEDDLRERIDMAIDMNDHDWFLQLTSKLP